MKKKDCTPWKSIGEEAKLFQINGRRNDVCTCRGFRPRVFLTAGTSVVSVQRIVYDFHAVIQTPSRLKWSKCTNYSLFSFLNYLAVGHCTSMVSKSSSYEGVNEVNAFTFMGFLQLDEILNSV